MLQVKRVAGTILLVVSIALVVFVAIANAAFYGPLPADLPCRGCTGEARAVHVDGFDLYYREVGSASGRAPIVVLHGGPGHSSQSFKRSFDPLSDEYRVVYYDQRGSGGSQIIPDSMLYTIDHLVEELEVLRRDVIGADRMVILGHSAGGALAQRYALAYPQRVERLILVASIPANNGVSAAAIWDRVIPAVFVLSAGWPPADSQDRDRWFAQINETTSVPRLSDPSKAALLHDAGYLSFATWREVSRSLEGQDYSGSLGQLHMPSLVIYGAADGAQTGEPTAASLCASLPDCTLARFDHSGHWPFLEEPDLFSQTLRDFLADRR